jgi:hypothetical protein
MRTLWADSLDSDSEQLSSVHLLSRSTNEHFHIRGTLPLAAQNDIAGHVRPAGRQLPSLH